MKRLLIVVAVLAMTFIVGGVTEPAAALTPQETVSVKVAYNQPLTPTDQYVFFLMVKSVAPDTPDKVITDALAWYAAGVRDPLLALPTRMTMTPTDGGADGVAFAGEGSPGGDHSGEAEYAPCSGVSPTTFSHWFSLRIVGYNVTNSRMVSSDYGQSWHTRCLSHVDGFPGELVLYDRTTAAAVGGWRFPNGPFPFRTELWQGQFVPWRLYSGEVKPFGQWHRLWIARWERCVTIPVVGATCIQDQEHKMHIDTYGDGFVCVSANNATRRCYRR